MSHSAMQPLVSIVTPSYNCGRYIEETILSIKEQDYPNIEHIVVDGGSQDNTLEILKMYKDQNVEGYYDSSIVTNYNSRYNLFILTVVCTGFAAISIPLIIRLSAS